MDDFKNQQLNDSPKPDVAPQETLMPVQKFVPPSQWQGIKEFYFANKWYVWAIVLGVVIIGVLAFFALRPQKAGPTKEANVQVSIEAPESSPSGSEVIYKIKMENQDSASLVDLELELVYPNGVNYVSSSPKADNLSGSRFAVPDLSSGQNAVVIVKTTAQGDINDDKRLVARLHYHYSNFNSEFVKEAEHVVKLIASDVSLELTGAQESTNAQIVTYELNYSNSSDNDINNARIEVEYPEGFSFADSNPKPDLSKNIWNVATLKQGQSGKIGFQGSFKSAQPGQSQTFTAKFQALDNQGNYYTQATATFSTRISALPLVITQSLDSGTDSIVKPGDTIRYTLKYQNTASVAATGVNVLVTVDPKSVDLASIRAEGGDVSSGTISWNASGVRNFERLNPNDSGTLRFSLRVKNPAVKDSSKNVTINTSVKIKSNEYSTFLPGNDLAIKVTSPASLEGDAAHVNGQLPIQVGTATTFQVAITLRNSTNDFTNGVLTGFVPNGVTFVSGSVNSKESGSVTFDQATGKITWKVGTLAAHTGDFNPPRVMTFQVKVNPSVTQVGDDITIFRNIIFNGKDEFIGQDISLQTDDVKTSDIPNGLTDGRVIP